MVNVHDNSVSGLISKGEIRPRHMCFTDRLNPHAFIFSTLNVRMDLKAMPSLSSVMYQKVANVCFQTCLLHTLQVIILCEKLHTLCCIDSSEGSFILTRARGLRASAHQKWCDLVANLGAQYACMVAHAVACCEGRFDPAAGHLPQISKDFVQLLAAWHLSEQTLGRAARGAQHRSDVHKTQ